MSAKTREYIKSSVITFVTGFCLVFIAQIDHITLETVTSGAVLSTIFVAVRAGIKALMEAFLASRA